MADSILNFTPQGNAGIAVTNTTSFAADVKFTLYNADGTVASSNLTNPFTHRIAPMGQLAMMASEIFRLNKAVAWPGGWIQATSSVSGLQGYYFSGDFVNTFDGAEASTALQLQTIPYIGSGARTVLITNPGTQSAAVTVSFLNEAGFDAVEPVPLVLSPHGQQSIPGFGVTARVEVTAGPAVVATAIAGSATQLLLIHGQQSTDPRTVRKVVPHFKNAGGFRSYLALANPSSVSVPVGIFFYSNEGGTPAHMTGITLPPFGTRLVSWNEITKSIHAPDGEGWLAVESHLPLVGLSFLDDGFSAAAVPLQSSGSDRILISRTAIQGLTSELILVGPAEGSASLTVTFNRPDGSTALQKPFTLTERGRVSLQLGDEIPSAARFDAGFVTIRSSAPVYALEHIRLGYGAGLATVTPQRLSTSFVAGATTVTMAKVALVDSLTPLPGAQLRVTAEGVGGLTDPTLWVGDRSLPLTASDLNGTQFTARLPLDLEPGPITARVRSGGVESASYLGFYSLPNYPIGPDDPVLKGYASFQKIEVTDSGLDTSQISNVPIRFARVEIRDGLDNLVIATGTDETGRFQTSIPGYGGGFTVRVLSRARFQDLKVLNNTANSAIYFIPRVLDPSDFDSPEDEIELFETSRTAGAFNILDTINKGNTLVAAAVPNFVPPPLTVYWSEKNNDAVLSKLTNGQIRTTFFSLAANAAYILGDRATDSDEYDDSVILHEYAHMLAAKFSRDDSNGGMHLPGDLLDPRIAWSEGWANFFSSAVRGTSIYRDSKAGTNVLRFDIEENVPAVDRPGYTSEASVHGLLWDLIDENADTADVAQFPFSAIWGAFTDLTLYRNVYLPYFLDRFLVRYPQFSDPLRAMVVERRIDFQPDGRPSVTNPFPRTIGINDTKQGQQVDSFTSKRTNLANSAHFYSLTVPTGGLTSIRLFIDGPGPANNPSANDLDLFLYDSNMQKKGESDIGFDGDGEVITMPLAAGTYFIEVRSFYTREQTNSTVFNSGTYRLSVTR